VHRESVWNLAAIEHLRKRCEDRGDENRPEMALDRQFLSLEKDRFEEMDGAKSGWQVMKNKEKRELGRKGLMPFERS
jgi:hypothetical protein